MLKDYDGIGAHLTEQLASVGPVKIRRMFSGAGVFLDGLMFGLIIDAALYLKVDSSTQLKFASEGLAPLTYVRGNGKRVQLNYRQAPERLLDDADEMREWALTAIAVAQRRAKTLSKSKSKTTTTAKRKPRSVRFSARH